MTLLAVCTGDPSPGFATVIALIGLVGYVLPLGAAFATARPDSRARLALVLGVALAIGFVFGYVIPGGLDGTANYFALFVAGTALATAFGAAFAAVADTGNAWRHVVLGTLGGSAFLAWAVGLLLFGIAVGGGCLG